MSKSYFFTEQETAKLKQMYDDFYALSEIAKELGKSEGSIQQKVFRLKLPPRDCNLIRMIGVHGRGLLRYGNSVEAIRKAQAEEVKTRRENKKRVQQAAINRLKNDLLHRVDRNVALTDAYKAGATLSQIGSVVGMTKQNVSLIVNPPKKALT